MSEEDVKVAKVRRYLPSGPMPDGSVRQNGLLQFWEGTMVRVNNTGMISPSGSMRTVNVKAIIDVR